MASGGTRRNRDTVPGEYLVSDEIFWWLRFDGNKRGQIFHEYIHSPLGRRREDAQQAFSQDYHGRTRLTKLAPILRRGWQAQGRGSLNGTFCGLLGRIVPQEMSGRIFLGVDQEGNLLVTELKRDSLREDAVTQALGYAAEYSSLTPDQIAEMYLAHSGKHGNTGLLSKATSIKEAKTEADLRSVGEQRSR